MARAGGRGGGERYARAARARSMLSLGFMRRAAALTKIELYSAPRSGAYKNELHAPRSGAYERMSFVCCAAALTNMEATVVQPAQCAPPAGRHTHSHTQDSCKCKAFGSTTKAQRRCLCLHYAPAPRVYAGSGHVPHEIAPGAK